MSFDEFEREYLARQVNIRERLKNATSKDFQIVHIGEPYPYAASLDGCTDIAVFKRKADCERFIKTFDSHEEHQPQ